MNIMCNVINHNDDTRLQGPNLLLKIAVATRKHFFSKIVDNWARALEKVRKPGYRTRSLLSHCHIRVRRGLKVPLLTKV
jgi:hypothetical protein